MTSTRRFRRVGPRMLGLAAFALAAVAGPLATPGTAARDDGVAAANGVPSGADVSIAAVASTAPATPGGAVTITVTVANKGDGPADDVVARVPLPSNARAGEIPHAALAPVCGQSSSAGEWVCRYEQLLAGESHTTTLTLILDAASLPGNARGIAVVTSASADVDPSNNTAHYLIDVAAPQYALTTTIAAPEAVAAGEPSALAQAARPAALAFTGSSSEPLFETAVLLVVAGALFVLIARRRLTV